MGRRDEVRTNKPGGYIQTLSPSGYDILINGIDRYLNFGVLSGSTGYGLRDNGGNIEYKNSGGTWTAIGSGGGASKFTDLTDVPQAYTGQGGKVVAVKADVSGLEFITQTSTDEKVKYDAGDPTAGYVADKIVAGTGISVAEGSGANENKLVITNSNPTEYTLPTAAAGTLGGIKVGTRLSIDGSGVLSADVQSGGGDTVAPATNTDSYIPQRDGANSKTLKNGIDPATLLTTTTGLKLDQTTPQTVSNGYPRFNEGLLGGTDSNKTDFPKATAVFSAGDSGHTYADRVGIIGESIGETGVQGIGVGGVAKTNGYFPGIGVFGRALATSGDAAGAVGIQGEATATHTGGSNIAVKADAQNGLLNYSFYGANGVLYNDDPIRLGLTPTVGAHATGKMFWDATWKTAAVDLEDDVTLQIGQETMAYVYNGTASTLTQGQVVYTAGTQAGVPSVDLAKGDADSTSQVLGVITSTSILAGAYGYATIRGHVNNIDTSAWNLNDNLYLSADTAGLLTNVRPLTGEYDTRVGRVMLKDASTGRVYVNMVREYTMQTAPVGGSGVDMFPDDTSITATGTNNAYPIKTLSKIPVTTAEDVDTITMNNSTVMYGTYLNTDPIGKTTIDGGVWVFELYAGVSSAVNVTRLLVNVNRVRPGTGTITTTGTGTTRTATASTGTPFATANIDVGGTIDSDSFLQTPQGLYRILSRVSDVEITIETLTTYTNEVAATYSTHKKLFGVTTPEINNTATSPLFAGLQLYTVSSAQPAFTVASTDTLASAFFGTSDGVRSVYFSHNGTTRYSHFSTPLLVKHNDLPGLNEGDYQHLTAAQLAVVNATSGTNTGDNAANNTVLALSGGTMTGKTVSAGRTEVAKTYTPATGSQTVTIDCSVNNMHIVTGHASGTAITFAITGATENQPFIISILQGGTTVSTISAWFATVRWAGGTAPTLTATLNKRDTFGFIRTGTDTYDGFIIGQNA